MRLAAEGLHVSLGTRRVLEELVHSRTSFVVTGGTVDITASDDGMNATAASTGEESEASGQAGPGGGGGGEADDGSQLVISGGTVTIDASGSSQFVSALLLSAVRFNSPLVLHHEGGSGVPSLPHVDMTVSVLRDAGVAAERIGDTAWRVSPREVVVSSPARSRTVDHGSLSGAGAASAAI